MMNLNARSLSKELTVGLFFLVFIVEGALLALVYTQQSNSLRLELEKRGDDAIASLTDILAVPLWNFDDEQIGRIGAIFVQDKAVHKLYIRDGQDTILYAYGSEKDEADTIRRERTIVYREQPIGRVELFLSLNQYRRELTLLRNIVLLMLAGSLVVIFIATGLLLRILLRGPLNSLQNGIDRAAMGDYSYGFSDIRHLELSDIAKRFGEMASKIHERELTLNRINQELAAEIEVRREIEERIRKSEAQSLALLNAIPDLIVRFDRDGCILDHHGSTEALHTADPDAVGRCLGDLYDTDTTQLFQRHIEKALGDKKMQFFEYTLERGSRNAYYECRIVSVTDHEVLCIVRNITRIKHDARERLRLEEQLRQAQKMEALGTLAGGVAHDLNNILSGIVSYPELLLMDLPEESPMRRPLTTIKNSGEKAATIVQDLLTLARRGVTAMEVVNLNDILEHYLSSPEMTRLKAYHPGVDIVSELDPGLLNILGSQVHLSKTVMNLTANAAEAMPEGGTVHISTSNRYVDLPVKGYDDVAEGDYAVMRIADSGVGISPEDMERIFEPFYTKKKMGRSGTGLGMAVVWGTVKDHKGYINIRSRPQEGTVLTLYFPATRQSVARPDQVVSLSDCAGGGESVLVVDDVQEQREIAAGMLRKLNYSVVTVESGEQAIEYMKTHAADLLVLDMIMDPGIDGLETYRRILENHPGQKAIIASGFSETDRVRATQRLGAGSYLRKPYTMEKLGLAVKRELEGNGSSP